LEAYNKQLHRSADTTRRADPALPSAAGNKTPPSTDQASRAAELESQIKLLQAQLDALRKTGDQWTKVPRKELGGLEPVEVVRILTTLAGKRFGGDGQKPFQVTADSEGLSLQGTPETVRWAREMIKKLTEK
jgi:hypothetical protein